MDLPDPGIKPGSPALQADSLPAERPEVLLINNKHLLITVLEARMSRIKMLAGLASDENLFPTDDYLLDTASHAGRDKQLSRVSFYKGTNPIHRGSAFKIQSSLTSPTSKYHHTRGLGFPHRCLRRIHSNHSRYQSYLGEKQEVFEPEIFILRHSGAWGRGVLTELWRI